MYKSSHRNKRNMKKQGNMTPQKVITSTVSDSGGIKVDEIPKIQNSDCKND